MPAPDHAATTPWLDSLPEAIRAFILDRARVRRHPARHLVYAIGDEGDGLYQVIAGEVRLYAYPKPGRQLLTLSARAGAWFGELSVLDGGPRPQDAVCHGAATVRHLPMRAIDAYAREDPTIFRHIALISCGHQRAALRFIGATLSNPGRARVARAVLALLEAGGGDTVAITQDDLAGRVGISRPHLNVLLADLRRIGGVATSYGRIRVVDRDALRAAAMEAPR